MKYICYIIYFLSFILSVQAQKTKTTSSSSRVYHYKNGNISIQKWYTNKKLDSVKTYHKTGELDEQFYYLNGRYQGVSTKFNRTGEKVTTWNFNNGRLIDRKDFILEFNKKNEEKIKTLHVKLKELNTELKANPRDVRSRINRAHIRHILGNRTLALNDYNWMNSNVIKSAKRNKTKPPGKILGSIYDVLGGIYSYYNLKNHASHYRHRAVIADYENNRLIFNLGAYLYSIKSYRLSKIYLDKVLKKSPNHGFVHRVLAAYYSDFEDYEKAKQHIDIAFPKEKNLLKFGSGRVERDIRTLRGFILHNLGDSEKGLKDLKEAIKLNKDNSFAHRNIGVVYFDLDQYELACNHLNKAKELGYEKKHDRDDLETYLDLSCNNYSNQKKQLIIEERNLSFKKLKDKPFIYPNPTKDIVQLANFNEFNFDFVVSQYDGKILKKGVSSNNSIDISNLPIGIYILKISKNGKNETFRVVKE